MDGVHLHGDRLPPANKHEYVGKEGFPTVAFNCHGSHNCGWSTRRIQPKARNDETVLLFDELVKEVTTNPLFTYCYNFEVMNAEGEMEHVIKGA